MNKIIITFILMIFLFQLGAQEREFNEEDIIGFIELAGNYMKMAIEMGISEELTFEEVFMLDDESLYYATLDFLNENHWTYEKMTDFILEIGSVVYYLSYSEQQPDLDQSLQEGFELSPEIIQLVRPHFKDIKPFFQIPFWDEINNPEEWEGMKMTDFDMTDSIAGNWVYKDNTRWVWHFSKNKVSVEEIIGAEARLPVIYSGNFKIVDDKIMIKYEGFSPHPPQFKLTDGELVAEDDRILIPR